MSAYFPYLHKHLREDMYQHGKHMRQAELYATYERALHTVEMTHSLEWPLDNIWEDEALFHELVDSQGL